MSRLLYLSLRLLFTGRGVGESGSSGGGVGSFAGRLGRSRDGLYRPRVRFLRRVYLRPILGGVAYFFGCTHRRLSGY